MDRLDRALRSEETLTPSTGFTRAVMADVHRAAEAPHPLPFPWRRVLVVLALGFAVGGAGLALIGLGVIRLQTLADWAGRLLDPAGSSGDLARLAAVLFLTFLSASLPRWLEV